MVNIGLIGDGVVGGAVKFGFQKIGHLVKTHDIKYETTISEVLDTEIIFICVPTPSNPDGSCDISNIESCIQELKSNGYKNPIVIKSTVPPGTTESLKQKYSLNISFVPEFLRERCAIYDFVEKHDLLAIGSEDKVTIETIINCHGTLPKSVVVMSTSEAELLKYYSNIFNALRIIFANEMYEVSKSVGADYSKIKNAFLKHSKIPDIYLDVNDNFRGYAGTCLPKDVKAIAYLCKDKNLDLSLFSMLDSENEKFKKTVFKGMRL